ncbi:hypothetical protein [Sphingobium sp.]|uniref:hypothetical protein n=1 Tax=Sphingobium sp. TaxID=1912891 RepID=UPI0028BE9783|nr:hypothetical protein [Sphingobium sp.]
MPVHKGGRRYLLAGAFKIMAISTMAYATVTPPIQPPAVNGPNTTGPVKLTDPSADRSSSCSETCLRAVADSYFKALEKRDYSKLTVAPNLIVTENGQASRIGDGLWRVLEKFNQPATYFFDPVAGQVIALTTIEESAHQPFILMVRLKVEERRIAEVETMLTSDIDAGQHFQPDNVARLDPVLTQTLPQQEQPSREELIGYSDAWWYDAGRGMTAGADCVHWENAEPLPMFKCPLGSRRSPTALSYANRALRNVVIDPRSGLIITYLLSDTTPYLNPNPPDFERTPLFYRQPLTTYKVQILKIAKGGVVHAHHVFMNYQAAGLRAIFEK